MCLAGMFRMSRRVQDRRQQDHDGSSNCLPRRVRQDVKFGRIKWDRCLAIPEHLSMGPLFLGRGPGHSGHHSTHTANSLPLSPPRWPPPLVVLLSRSRERRACKATMVNHVLRSAKNFSIFTTTKHYSYWLREYFCFTMHWPNICQQRSD